MRTYYRGNDAVVTSELFVRRSASTKSFAIREMRNVCISCADGTGRSKPLVAVAALLGLTATAAAWSTGSWYALVLFAAAAPTGAAALFWRPRPARWELRAVYRGQDVALYASADVRVFNQVTRALRRAIEDDRHAPTWEEDDAA
jgi:Family of unknown function (DUF6232)